MVNTSGKGVRDPGFKSLISQNFFFFAIKNVYTDDKVLHKYAVSHLLYGETDKSVFYP